MLKIVKTSLVIAASTLAFSNAAQANDINEALAKFAQLFKQMTRANYARKCVAFNQTTNLSFAITTLAFLVTAKA